MPLFWTGNPESLFKFVTIFNKIIWGQDVYMGPHKFGMTRNLIIGEALQVFEQNSRESWTETNANYELVMKFLISHFCPPKALQIQNSFLRRGFYKPCNTKILDFIYIVSTRWSSTSIISLPLGMDNAYQNTRSSSWWVSYSWRSGRNNSSSKGSTPLPKAPWISLSSVSVSRLISNFPRRRVK